MARACVLDTSFWIALYDSRDQQLHLHARSILKKIFQIKPVVYMPWPIYYEVLNTRFVRRSGWVREFSAHAEKLTIKTIDDSLYREKAYAATIREAIIGRRHISLVDMVIRQVLEDRSLKIDYLITFNQKDFLDVCRKGRIELHLL